MNSTPTQPVSIPCERRRAPWRSGLCVVALLIFTLPAACESPSPPPQPTTGPVAAVRPAAVGLGADSSLRLSPEDRCPVCAMKVDKHKKFASAIVLDDETTFYFCGTGCMLKTWLHPDVFLGRAKGKLKRAVTQEYFGGKPIDAAQAHWVAGSDVVGPMGPVLVPLASEEDATTFKARHGGSSFKFSELDDAKWEELMGKKATMKPGPR